MSSYILLERIKVENANCIAGFTYGFPAITALLGLTHALSRKFSSKFAVNLNGCAVFSHDYTLHTYKSYDIRFTQSKSSSQDGKPSPIIEEGKMDLTISLLLECDNDLSGTDFEQKDYKHCLKQLVYESRLAGGSIYNLQDISFWNDNSDIKKLKRKLLPSFVLMDINHELQKHVDEVKKDCPNKDLFDIWTDFFAYKEKCSKQADKNENIWEEIKKPKNAWVVPLMVGYKGISTLYEGGKINNVRDPNYPFRFVESVHGIGQWKSVHRIKKIEEIKYLIWKYYIEDEWYLCKQNIE